MIAHIFEGFGIFAAVALAVAFVTWLFLRGLKPGDVP